MKHLVSPCAVIIGIAASITPLSAQNLAHPAISSVGQLKPVGAAEEISRYWDADQSAAPGTYDVPATDKVSGDVTDEAVVFHAQDALSLRDKSSRPQDYQSLMKLDVLRRPSPYRRMLVSSSVQTDQIATDGLQSSLAEISAAYREVGKTEQSADCTAIARSIHHRIQADPDKLLEVVEAETAANPACACEVVKAAITASEAETETVVNIAETAIHAAPESMRIISQCAIAASPESIAAIQALLTRLDPNAGDSGYSSKSAKSSKGGEKVSSIIAPPLPNPLDLPPSGPPITPPPIYPPKVTDVDPCR